jgi:hypothetical protein
LGQASEKATASGTPGSNGENCSQLLFDQVGALIFELLSKCGPATDHSSDDANARKTKDKENPTSSLF